MAQHSIISAGGVTVEVKDKRVFVDGMEIKRDQIQQARAARTHGLFMFIAGFVVGVFCFAVITTIQ